MCAQRGGRQWLNPRMANTRQMPEQQEESKTSYLWRSGSHPHNQNPNNHPSEEVCMYVMYPMYQCTQLCYNLIWCKVCGPLICPQPNTWYTNTVHYHLNTTLDIGAPHKYDYWIFNGMIFWMSSKSSQNFDGHLWWGLRSSTISFWPKWVLNIIARSISSAWSVFGLNVSTRCIIITLVMH